MAGGTFVQAAAETVRSLHQLPAATALVGRDAVLDELEIESVRGHSSGVTVAGAAASHIVLQGMGGVGKTALAVALAHRLSTRYPDAQLVFNLRGLDHEPATPDEIMQRTIQSFHPRAKRPDNRADLAALYRSVLAGAGRVLLVLDNAASNNQVEPLLPPPNCLLIVTSRAQFHLRGLTCRALDCLSSDAASALLLRLAPRVSEHAENAATLCGGLPLAIEVFAGTVNDKSLHPLPELLDRLRSGVDRLGKVDAAFALSLEIIGPELRGRWAQLAVFAGSFDLSACAAVWGDDADGGAIPTATRDAMEGLLCASLVQHAQGERLRLHDLARAYAERQLTNTGATAARNRHAEHYCAVGACAESLYLRGNTDVLRGLSLFDSERMQIEAAFEWLSTRSDPESAKRLVALVAAIEYVAGLRFHPRKQIIWLEAQCNAARRNGDRKAEASALGNLGNAYTALGEARKAIEINEQCLTIAREIGFRRAECDALGNFATAYAALGEARKAIEFSAQCLAIAREIGDRRREGYALGSLGAAYAAVGDRRKAIEFYEQQLVIAREIGDRGGEGNTLGNLGTAYAALREARKAIEFSEQCRTIAQEIGDRGGEGYSLGILGCTYAILGDVRKAIDFHEQALVIDREIGYRGGEGTTLGNLGNAYAALGEMGKAIECYEKALLIAKETGDRRGEGSTLFNSALAMRRIGKSEEAVVRADAALAILEEIDDDNAAEVRAKVVEWRGGARFAPKNV